MSPSEKILTFPRAPARTPSLPVRSDYEWDDRESDLQIATLRRLRGVKIVAGPSVIAQDVARVVELPDGSGRVEYWVKGKGWIEAPPGLFTPDEFMPGACLPVSARTAARLDIPASEL